MKSLYERLMVIEKKKRKEAEESLVNAWNKEWYDLSPIQSYFKGGTVVQKQSKITGVTSV